MHSSTSQGSCPLVLADSYLMARARFLSLAKTNNTEITSFQNTGYKGIENEPLFCDMVSFGPQTANKTLVITSGTHGVEGYCGSAIQCRLLEAKTLIEASQKIRVVLVHAINPYGFSHFHRVNENNVDLNRNFVKFSNNNRTDQDYALFRRQVFPEKWEGSDLATIQQTVTEFIRKFGENHFQQAITRGQYSFPDDPYYGGAKETWSRSIWDRISSGIAIHSDIVAHIDIHTGLGEYGTCELIYGSRPDPANIKIANDWFGKGEIKVPSNGNSLSAEVSGTLGSHMDNLSVTNIAIGMEFGTVPIEKMLSTLIADNWAAHNQDTNPDLLTKIRNDMKNAFFSNDPEWLRNIWKHSMQSLNKTITGLTNI